MRKTKTVSAKNARTPKVSKSTPLNKTEASRLTKLELFMDENRLLYVKDRTNEYRFWPLGYGVPVVFMVKTKEEIAVIQEEQMKADEEQAKKYAEAIEEQRQKKEARKLINILKRLFNALISLFK